MFEKIKRWIRFNLFYLGRPPWDTGIAPPELTAFLSTIEPGRALDVGCGTGTNILAMAQKGWEVVGMDIAWLSIVRARRKLGQAGFHACVIHSDIAGEINLQKPFDFILDIGCYHSLSIKERQNYHETIQRLLSPNGTYMMYGHRRTSPDHSHGISSRDMEAFQGYLELQWREDNQEKRPDGGGGRPSTWARFEKKQEISSLHI